MSDNKRPSSDVKSISNGVATPGARCEVKTLLQRQKKEEVEIVEKDSKSTLGDPYAQYALVSKQSFDENHKLTGTMLEINSPQLLAALKDVVTYYPGEPLGFNTKFTIEDPFMMLVYHREELREYRETTSDATTKMHIMLLLDYLEKEAGQKGAEINDMIASGVITFPLLWMIFKPGDLIFEHKHGHARLFQVQRHGYGEHRAQGKYFDISCSFTSYDGIKVGTAGDKLRIWDRKEFFTPFSSQITALSVFPVKFLDCAESSSLQDRLSERGRRYLEIRDMCVMRYHGLYLYLRRPPWDFYDEVADYDGTFLPETTSGRVIIDPKTFNEEARAKKEHIAAHDRDDEERDKKDLKPALPDVSGEVFGEGLDTRLCPSYVYGFSLEKKEWCQFFVDFLTEVEWKPNALESLIIPQPQKRLLQGLATAHRFPDSARDEIGLKGKGLVVLLHGAPGSGKTLTAEMTAEHTHRALLNISTGELGSYQYRVEYELKRLLTYASTFQAIVLVDEADVFLEARQSGPSDQLHQNAMVAVFLRQLEYFQGIIFLTSNRVTIFDPAIRSRIHLALQYASPSKEIRRLIWKKHFANVPAASLDLNVEEALDAVENTKMNGREISNSITTARTLAESEGSKLKIEYLQIILQVWSKFEETFGGLQKLELK